MLDTTKGKHRTSSQFKSVVIEFAKSTYKEKGKLRMQELYEKFGYKRFILEFEKKEQLLIEAGLPDFAFYGKQNCKKCGCEFVKKQTRQVFCSRKHEKEHAAEKQKISALIKKRSCKVCGKAYQKKDGGFNLFCGKLCRNEAIKKRRRDAIKKRNILVDGKTVPFTLEELIKREGGKKCSHCSVETIMSGSPQQPNYLNVDHIIPISRGGHNAIYNAQILCFKCNIKKGNKIYSIDKDKAKKLWPANVEDLVLLSRNYKKSTNTSGFNGVVWCKDTKKWKAHIQIEGKKYHLGSSKNKSDVIAIRKEVDRLLKDGYKIKDIKRELSGKHRRQHQKARMANALCG